MFIYICWLYHHISGIPYAFRESQVQLSVRKQAVLTEANRYTFLSTYKYQDIV